MYLQNKLIEAYERKEKLTNKMVKEIHDDKISFHKKKIQEIRDD